VLAPPLLALQAVLVPLLLLVQELLLLVLVLLLLLPQELRPLQLRRP
jgi:hypothetical protein